MPCQLQLFVARAARIMSDIRGLWSRSNTAAEGGTQGAPSARVFRRRWPRANRQCLVSQPEDGDGAADGSASEAAPAGPDDMLAGPEAVPRRASASAGEGVQAAVSEPAGCPGVPSLGCSKCRHAARGCGKCRHDRWTALKVSR